MPCQIGHSLPNKYQHNDANFAYMYGCMYHNAMYHNAMCNSNLSVSDNSDCLKFIFYLLDFFGCYYTIEMPKGITCVSFGPILSSK